MSKEEAAPAGPPGPPAPREPEYGPDGELLGGPRTMQQQAAQRRLQQTQAQVDEVVEIMKTNMDKVLERDHLIGDLSERAEALEDGASQFKSQAASLKNKFWLENLKMMIIMGVIGLIIIGILYDFHFGRQITRHGSFCDKNVKKTREFFLIRYSGDVPGVAAAPAAGPAAVAPAGPAVAVGPTNGAPVGPPAPAPVHCGDDGSGHSLALMMPARGPRGTPTRACHTHTSPRHTRNMFTRFDQGKSTKGASKLRRDLINAEIANLRDLLPLPPSTRQRLSQLQLMALVCVYVRKSNYFQQVFKRFDINQQQSAAPNFGFSKALNGFLMMMTQNGKLLYISDNAAEYLGHSMEDLLIHGDSVYDVIDKQDQQAVRGELSRAPADGEERVFLCRMNVARNARRQMRFGDQKVVLVRGHYVSYLPLCSRNEPVFLAVCTPLAMPETRECVVHGATNVFTTVHGMDMKILHIDTNEWHLGWDRSSLHGVSWYHLLHPDCCKEAQSKHRLITQSEQERSCIALLRLQRRSGQFLWVHAVLQLKDNLDNSQRPVIVCTNQVLSEEEATVMKANPWLYHYYAVQSKLHYGLAYEAATRMYGPPPPDLQVYPPAMQYTPTPPVCINGNQVMMPNASLQPHIPHVPTHLAPMSYVYERTDNGPVDYSVSLQDNRYHNIRIEDTSRIQSNAKRKGKNSEDKPNTPVPNMSPRCTSSTVTSGGDTLVAVTGSIASRRPGSKNFNITETEMVDQWNPSPTWSESALQKVPDVCHQDLSPYVTTTPPTPSGTPSAYTQNYSHTFVFDWSPEQYVPHTNNRCNTITTESSYQQTWNRSQRTSFANSAETVDENCNPNRLSLQMRVSNPPPAYNATREGEILRRQIDRPHTDSPDAKKPAL